MQQTTENNIRSPYRDDMPPVPKRMQKLPVERGYPVPWFVDFVDGKYDFRIADGRKMQSAIDKKLCWLCGEHLGSSMVFVIGPMCAVNRISSEPPSHRECAEFAAKACPFLIQQQTRRRETDMPEGTRDMPGLSIKRQPGVALLWGTRSYRLVDAPGGVLFQIGEPELLLWMREGRAATRAEILHSIETGLPILRGQAAKDGRMAVLELESQIKKAMTLIPSETPKVRRAMFGSAARCQR